MIDIEDIIGSIQNTRLLNLRDDVKFCYDSFGRIKYHTGGYAVVFPCSVGGKKRSIRCWHTQIADSDERYRNIAKEFSEAGFLFILPFEYYVDSLIVDGREYPFMAADWMEGKNIKDYVWQNRTDAPKLSALARRFLVMCSEMEGRGVSHGDFQHGNVIVSEYGRPRLIDYDSVWTQGMGKTSPDIIKGLAAYQHPQRKDNPYGFNGRDRFSQLVIYLSILAVMRGPALAEKYQFASSEHMLFTASDFNDWRHSQVRDDLCRLCDGEIDDLTVMMDCYLEMDDITSLPPFYLF